MSILSGPEIKRQVSLGNIIIKPFDEGRLGPNSYDVSLGHELLMLGGRELDLTVAPPVEWVWAIPESGFVLQPGKGYLASTVERVGCKGYVPCIDGRSTCGRYFLTLHQTAGRGDTGWDGHFTLEVCATFKPVRVYAGMPLAQITFFTVEGELSPYSGRYQGSVGPVPPKPLRRVLP